MASPAVPSLAVHGPYEDLAIAGLNFLTELVKGMSPEQRVLVWQNWIDFWQPLVGKK